MKYKYYLYVFINKYKANEFRETHRQSMNVDTTSVAEFIKINVYLIAEYYHIVFIHEDIINKKYYRDIKELYKDTPQNFEIYYG